MVGEPIPPQRPDQIGDLLPGLPLRKLSDLFRLHQAFHKSVDHPSPGSVRLGLNLSAVSKSGSGQRGLNRSSEMSLPWGLVIWLQRGG